MNPTDPRDSQIAALENQCAALQREILNLKAQVDPATIVLSPERSSGGSALLEVYWKTQNTEFSAGNLFQATIPMGGFVSTRYIEIPADAAGHIRIDPSNQPGLFLFSFLTLHDLDEQGAIVQPPLLTCDPRNGFGGLTPVTGCTVLPVVGSGRQAVGRVLAWDNDPQLLIRLPENRLKRTRLLTLACAALDSAHAIMGGYGDQLFEEIAKLSKELRSLQAQNAQAQNAAPRRSHQAAPKIPAVFTRARRKRYYAPFALKSAGVPHGATEVRL